jgi:intracellular septation protein
MSDAPKQEPVIDKLKFAIEFGPLLIFFATNFIARKLVGEESIFWATGSFMVATLVAMLVSKMRAGHIPPLLWVNGTVITVFGVLTIALHDDMFIKLKPTIVNLLFAAALFGGLLVKRNYLKLLLEGAFPELPDHIWRTLTIRWASFFVLLAVLNELVWRTQSTDFWVNFKVWGIMPITFLFTMSQLPLILKHTPDTDKKD